MVFKVYYQEIIYDVPIRENTQTIYVERRIRPRRPLKAKGKTL